MDKILPKLGEALKFSREPKEFTLLATSRITHLTDHVSPYFVQDWFLLMILFPRPQRGQRADDSSLRRDNHSSFFHPRQYVQPKEVCCVKFYPFQQFKQFRGNHEGNHEGYLQLNFHRSMTFPTMFDIITEMI